MGFRPHVLADEADLCDAADAMRLAERGEILVDSEEQVYMTDPYGERVADQLLENR